MDPRPTRPTRLLDSATAVGVIGAVLFFVVAATWSFSSPLMSAPDEPAQTIKAVSVAQGFLRGKDHETTIAGPPWVSSIDSEFTVPAAYAAIGALNACFVNQPKVSAACAPDPTSTGGEAKATTYVGTYPPTYYALIGWPSRFFDPDPGLWLMRLSSAAVSAALVGLALVGARRTDGGGIVVVGLLVALTPMAVYLTSVINPSGMEVTAALAVWTCALALVRPGDGRTTGADVARLAVALCAMVGVRTLSPVLAIGIVACVLAVAARRADLDRIRRAPGVRAAAAVVTLVTVAAVAYLAWSKAYASAAGLPNPGITLREALQGSLSKVVWRVRQMIGYFGYLEAPPPRALLAIWGVIGGGLAVVGLVAGTWRRRVVLVALVAATVVFTVVPEALNVHKVGYIWQGRYSLPVAVGIPVLAAWMLGRARWWRSRLVTPVVVSVAVLWVAGQLLGQAATLRRFITGTTGGLFDFVGHDGWRPPLPPWALIGLLLIGAGLFAGWVALTAVRAGRFEGADTEGGQPPTTSATSASSLTANASSP